MIGNLRMSKAYEKRVKVVSWKPLYNMFEHSTSPI